MMTIPEILALFGSALAAGAINAVAGGGTLLTFPALLFSGTGAVVANATSSFALTLGTAGSLFGFRRQWGSTRVWLKRFVPVSIAGGLLGSWLVRVQGEAVFVQVVPWLLIFATGLFLVQAPLQRWRMRRALRIPSSSGTLLPTRKSSPEPQRPMPGAPIAAAPEEPKVAKDAPESPELPGLSVTACVVLQFAVAIYGGYFGAGIGILMLAVLGLMGMADIHRMNALKNLLAAIINGTASLYFALSGLVDWPRAAVMLGGAMAGYWLGAHYSQKIPAAAVRAVVVFTGLAISASLFWKMLQ